MVYYYKAGLALAPRGRKGRGRKSRTKKALKRNTLHILHAPPGAAAIGREGGGRIINLPPQTHPVIHPSPRSPIPLPSTNPFAPRPLLYHYEWSAHMRRKNVLMPRFSIGSCVPFVWSLLYLLENRLIPGAFSRKTSEAPPILLVSPRPPLPSHQTPFSFSSHET